MALDDGDKAMCMEIAREIVKESLVEHIKCCPHGKLMMRNKMFLIGCTVGISLSGGIGGASAVMLFAKMFSGV